MNHNLAETTGVSFLEAEGPEVTESRLSLVWKRYTYRHRHLRRGVVHKVVLTLSVLVGGLWLEMNT